MALTLKKTAKLGPGRHHDKDGLYLKITPTGGSWLLRYQQDRRKHWHGLGSLKDFDLKEARERACKARQQLRDGVDPIAVKREQTARAVSLEALLPAVTLQERVANKYADLAEQGITPRAFLYRHFEPNGDLLYVGITLSVQKRTITHMKESNWRDQIFMIVIEPFATREEVRAAERQAIRTEFPKFNNQHNGHRHPIRELESIE